MNFVVHTYQQMTSEFRAGLNQTGPKFCLSFETGGGEKECLEKNEGKEKGSLPKRVNKLYDKRGGKLSK